MLLSIRGELYDTATRGSGSVKRVGRRNPALMQVAGDLIMRAQDFPMADQMADRLAKTLPPNLQEQEVVRNSNWRNLATGTADAEQMQQMDAALQEAQEKLQEAESGQAKAQLRLKQNAVG